MFLESFSKAIQMTDSLLAHVRNSGSFVLILCSLSTLIMTTLSCCLKESLFGGGGATVFFLEGVRLGRGSFLANKRGDFRSKWLFRGGFFRGVRASTGRG